jgi:hypothetical protein
LTPVAQRQIHHLASRNQNDMKTIRDNGHSDRVIKKCQRIAGLKALLEEWELPDNLDPD